MFTRGELVYSVKYPFSSRTKELAKWINFDLSSPDTRLLDRAKERVLQGIENGVPDIESSSHSEKILISEIVSYPLAKIMVARTKDRFLASRFAEAEANSFRKFLLGELDQNVESLAMDFGFSITEESIPFTDYLKYLPRDEQYKLVNSQLKNGQVRVGRETIANLLPEKLRAQLEHELLRVPDVPPLFDTYASEVSKEANREKAFRRNEDYGSVDAASFPPCMKVLIQDAQSGQPMAHQPRFTLATFLVNIGMSADQVTPLFANTPNFNEKKTRYYIEYSMGKRGSGVKYSPPSCEKMAFYGLCKNKDSLCQQIRHPLSYYLRKKKVTPNAAP